MPLTLPFRKLFSWIERKSANKYYPVYLTIILICISLFFAFPRYDLYANKVSWDVTMLKANDLTNNLDFISPDSFLAKKVFRLTVPVIIKIFHLNREAVLILQFILGFLFIMFSYKLAKRILKDAVAATFLTAGLIFIYAGRTCFIEISYTWFDGWAYFFILMAMYYRNIFLVFVLASLAAWTDERGLIALPVIILFHQLNRDRVMKFNLKELISLNMASIGVVAAMAGYIGLRLFLTSHYNMHTPSDLANFDVFKKNFIHNAIGFGAYTFLEGFWLLFPVVLYIAYKNKHYLVLGLMFIQMLLTMAAAFFVNDVTRSGSYLYASIFIFLIYLSRYMDTRYFRYLLLTAMFFCFLFPAINYVSFGDFEFRIEKPFAWVFYNIISR